MFPEWTIPVSAPLFYVAGAFIAFEAIRRARTPQGAVGWAVFLFAWPIVAVPLYLLFGYARVQSYAEARREADIGLPDGSEAAIPPEPEAAARLAACGRSRCIRCHAETR
jgi:cardiolipin synthase A/B